jgi:hypothetical protein
MGRFLWAKHTYHTFDMKQNRNLEEKRKTERTGQIENKRNTERTGQIENKRNKDKIRMRYKD